MSQGEANESGVKKTAPETLSRGESKNRLRKRPKEEMALPKKETRQHATLPS
jgi:hypothetical protein